MGKGLVQLKVSSARLVVVAVGMLAVGACDATPARRAPEISSFTITPDEVDCGEYPLMRSTLPPDRERGHMSWNATPNDVAVSFTVEVGGTVTTSETAGYSGSMTDEPLPANFRCDGNGYTTVTMVATNAAGRARRTVRLHTTVMG